MTEPEPTNDPDGDATDGDGSERGADGSRGPAADVDRRAKPVLADATAPDDDEADRSVNDPGVLREPEPIEPEAPRAENALFVLLGVLGTVALLATAIVPGLL